MRTIKFRGKCADDGMWRYGDLLHENGLLWINDNGLHCTVDENTVGQFTGWSRRGKFELYEGDVIGFDDWAFSERERKKMRHHVGVIEWSTDYGKWMIKCNDGFFEGNDVADPQLLGNIFDNPELKDLYEC